MAVGLRIPASVRIAVGRVSSAAPGPVFDGRCRTCACRGSGARDCVARGSNVEHLEVAPPARGATGAKIPLSATRVSPFVCEALIATEERSNRNHGIDLIVILRALSFCTCFLVGLWSGLS